MIVKVCGIKYQDNLEAISSLDIDMIGFNFYNPSARCVSSGTIDLDYTDTKNLSRVGVYVNSDLATIDRTASYYSLDFIQLHGDEGPDFIAQVSDRHRVIKVFRISESYDFNLTNTYSHVDYFLFDTFTNEYGGSGKRFDWNLLSDYQGKVPFLIAGGIAPDDVENILKIDHPMFLGVDINSKFEIEKGLKDPNLIKEFIHQLREE